MYACRSRRPKPTLMNNNGRSQIESGGQRRPLNSPAFGAAWGRKVGLALLLLSVAAPSFAGNRATLDNDTPSGKFSPDMRQRADADGLVTVIVQYRTMPAAAHLNALRAGGARIGSKFQ